MFERTIMPIRAAFYAELRRQNPQPRRRHADDLGEIVKATVADKQLAQRVASALREYFRSSPRPVPVEAAGSAETPVSA